LLKKLLEKEIPDLILLDIMMPGMSGWDVFNKINKKSSNIKVAFLSVLEISDKRKQVLIEEGLADYIMKPFEQAELRARLQNLLEQRKRLHEHFRKHGLFEIEEQKITSVDQKFLEKALLVITEQMSDSGFGVEILAERPHQEQFLAGRDGVDGLKRGRVREDHLPDAVHLVKQFKPGAQPVRRDALHQLDGEVTDDGGGGGGGIYDRIPSILSLIKK
jgi:hypothetical protein